MSPAVTAVRLSRNDWPQRERVELATEMEIEAGQIDLTLLDGGALSLIHIDGYWRVARNGELDDIRYTRINTYPGDPDA